tara:strand:- start:1476 stop:1853 length:378 start_codon:yes stop_codon:yes gene_type:complete
MSLTIDVKGIRAYGKHGVYIEEKKEEQLFLIDVKVLFGEIKELNDSLKKTINYETLVKKVVDLVKKESFNLIETLATKLVQEIEELAIKTNVIKNIKQVSITVHKPETQLNKITEDVSVKVIEEF